MNETMFVEAIEDGKIVSVSEKYAREEGLPILRRPSVKPLHPSPAQEPQSTKDIRKESRLDFLDRLKKPADWKEKQVLNELLENFHWHIRVERKKKGITRKNLAQMVGESEETIRTIEYGRLPIKDFVLVNKIQSALKINLRKDGKNYNQPASEMLERPKKFSLKNQDSQNDLSGSDIEILEDEI